MTRQKLQVMNKAATLTESTAEIVSGKSLWAEVWCRFRANRLAQLSLWLLIVMIIAVIAGPWFSPYAIDFIDWDYMSMAPNGQNAHYFGTDAMGRDLFVRTLYGGRISLLVGLLATLVSVIIGVSYGAVAGYLGGAIDEAMMRLVDILYALPFMFLVIMFMVVFGHNLWIILAAIGAYMWLDMARIVRGQTISLKNKAFIEAAQAVGASTPRIIIKHIVPNLLGIVVVYVTLTIPQVIMVESFLSFLGLGIQEPQTSWGALVNEGVLDMEIAAWSLAFPAGFLALSLMCFNFIGDGLRDAMDPRGA